MSIFKINNHFKLLKGIAVPVTALCCVLLFFPLYSHADDSNTTVFSQTLYHVHTGTEGVYGGCYTKEKKETQRVEKECGGAMVYWPELGTSSCDRCGAGYTGDQSGRKCFKTTTETVEKITYVLDCGMSGSTSLGTVTVTKSTNEWTKNLMLHASYEVNPKVRVKPMPYIWNGAAATDNADLEVTANGNYTLTLNTSGNVNAKKGTVTVEVKNIDVTGPVFISYEKEPKTEWTMAGVRVYNISAQDLQPDQTIGCGLHEMPISFDNGVTWTKDNTNFYTDNGTYEVLVRDKLDNISSQSIVISNIDKTPPTAELEYVRDANQPSVRITINANDLQPNGEAGCGLHEQPYSFDGGISWREESAYEVSKNSIVEIAVRDRLGNTLHLEEKISNIDSCGPKLKYTIEPEEWTSENVILHLSATDLNEDGTKGIGLPEDWYSLDNGISWKAEKKLEVTDNQTLLITLRDLYDNQTREQIVIDHIDRQPPAVVLESKQITVEDSKRVELIVSAKDTQSGLENKAYSWNNGVTYSDQKIRIVSENGSYTVKVRDRAGNVGKAVIQVNDFHEEESTEPEESEEETQISTEEPVSTEESESTEEPESTEEVTTIEVPDSEEEETESETVIVILEEPEEEAESIIPREIKEEKHTDIAKGIAVLLLALAVLLLAVLLLLAWLRSMTVYGKNRKGDWCCLGRVWIMRREERYAVNISKEMFEKCETAQFCFKPAWGFVQMHEAEEMYFYFPEEICITGRICEKIEIALF